MAFPADGLKYRPRLARNPIAPLANEPGIEARIVGWGWGESAEQLASNVPVMKRPTLRQRPREAFIIRGEKSSLAQFPPRGGGAT